MPENPMPFKAGDEWHPLSFQDEILRNGGILGILYTEVVFKQKNDL